MKRKIQLFCLFTMLCSGVAVAASPVAYVYVTATVSEPDTPGPIYAYSAASNGKLTPIKGSPFAVSGMGAAFPPFAKNAKGGAPDHLWQGKKYAPLSVTQYTRMRMTSSWSIAVHL
jgi:hypothetical protein